VAFGIAFSTLAIAVALFVTYALDATWPWFGHSHGDWADRVASGVGNDKIVAEIQRRLGPGELMAAESYTDVHVYALLSRERLETRLGLVHGGAHGLASLFWYRPDELRGKDFLFVTERPGLDAPLRDLFASVTEEEPYLVEYDGHVVRRVRFYRCDDLLHPEGAFSRLPAASPNR
jgi:hypothetical protein